MKIGADTQAGVWGAFRREGLSLMAADLLFLWYEMRMIGLGLPRFHTLFPFIVEEGTWDGRFSIEEM